MKDNSLKRSRFTSINKNYNLKNKFLEEKKIDKNFLNNLKHISIEDLVSLKLIVSMETINGKLYNFPFFKYCSDLIKEACLNFALSNSNSKKEAAMILGIPKVELNRLIKLYKVDLSGSK